MDKAEKYLRLEMGGVNNWYGYELAVERAEEDGFEWHYLSNEDKMDYLEAEGVDNWTWYGESLYGDDE